MVRFGLFELDLASGELRKRGVRVRLHEKPFRVLAALVARPGELVTRQELQRELWPGETFVDFDGNLNAAVRKLRDALGDSATSPRFIETLPRRGYRFIAPVEGEASAESRPPRRRRLWIAAGAIGAAVVIAIALAPQARLPAQGDERLMLAVLPFANLDADPDREFFCDGMTEELIAQLGRLQPERLGVIARISAMTYKDSDKDVPQIGRELGVDFLIEGSVRSSGDRLRITAQLIRVADRTHLWAESYDAEPGDLLDVQGDVAVRVAHALALELLPDRPLARARAGTRSTEAYEAYLQGRFNVNRFSGEGYRAAIAHFGRALEADPGYAAAHAALAIAHDLRAFTGEVPLAEAFEAARHHARRALELDPRSAEATAALAFVRLYHDYDFAGADAAFARALELDPNYAMAHHWWAGAHAAVGEHDRAIAAVRESLELDPVSLSVLSDLGWYYLYADRPEEGLAECRRVLDVQDYGWARACIDHALAMLGRGEPPAGEPIDAPGESSWQAMEQAAAGELDAAFATLERALERRDPWLVFLRVDPRFDPLAGDPRFESLAARIGLPG